MNPFKKIANILQELMGKGQQKAPVPTRKLEKPYTPSSILRKMNPYLQQLEKRLDEGQARYDNWRATQPGWEEIRMRENAPVVEYDSYEACREIYEEVCPYYLSTTAEERATIRDLFQCRIFWSQIAPLAFGYKMVGEVRKTQDVNKLRLGLAMMSIQNGYMDFRDVYLVLAKLYVVSEKYGLDPQKHFAEIAEVSAEEDKGGGITSMKETLLNIHGYAVVAEERKYV